MLAPIRIPKTKPATELIDGRLVQKLGGQARRQRRQRPEPILFLPNDASGVDRLAQQLRG